VMMPDVDGLSLVARVRENPQTQRVPLIFLTSRRQADDVVAGLELGADDYLAKPFRPDELAARVRAKLERRPVPAEMLRYDPRTGVLAANVLRDELQREVERASRGGTPGALALLELDELPQVRDRLGDRAEDAVARRLAVLVADVDHPLDVVGRLDRGRFGLLLPETDEREAERRLADVSRRIVRATFEAAGERLHFTPTIGFASYRAVATPAQVLATLLIGLVLPFLAYWGLDEAGLDITWPVYVAVVATLIFTAAMIWVEGLLAQRQNDPPDEPAEPYPTATAIIAAYLPNEAATIVETVESFLAHDYPGELQVVLAYNTPYDLPIEAELRAIAERTPLFVPFRVEHSTSKAQNVNAALATAAGAMVAVFDADHQPAPGAFARAWRWLSHGHDLVQGHCVVRNGDVSWVARTVAVEFESIYAVSHPGRARLHDFGIFGGTNGFWRSGVLREIRMRGSMLTEDIDSSMRVVEEGGRIASDPHLISRELGPATVKALWNQRMRWAQGWFQVSTTHLWRGLRSPKLSVRQKAGLFYLLGWREIYPWLSLQMFPIVAYWMTKGGDVDWRVPLFVATTIFTLGTGPGQVFFAYRQAAPEIRAHRGWFLWYLLVAGPFFTEFKNVIARVAQLKELVGERHWKVTPRA
jgi:diguanylate cyclase (GGDEF)-like protein